MTWNIDTRAFDGVTFDDWKAFTADKIGVQSGHRNDRTARIDGARAEAGEDFIHDDDGGYLIRGDRGFVSVDQRVGELAAAGQQSSGDNFWQHDADFRRHLAQTRTHDEGGSYAHVHTQADTGPLGLRVDGMETDSFELQFFDPSLGDWRTVVHGQNGPVDTDLGHLAAGTALQFRMINHDNGQVQTSDSGMAKVQQHPDGTITFAFDDEDLTGQPVRDLPGRDDASDLGDFNDLVVTVYQKDPAVVATAADLQHAPLTTGNNQDQLTLQGVQADNSIDLGDDHDQLIFQSHTVTNEAGQQETVTFTDTGSVYQLGHGDDQAFGAGSFQAGQFQLGSGNDLLDLYGTFTDVLIDTGAAQEGRLEDIDVDYRDHGGHDEVRLRGLLDRVAIATHDGRDTVSIDGPETVTHDLRIETGDDRDVVQLEGTHYDPVVRTGADADQIRLFGNVYGGRIHLGDGEGRSFDDKDGIVFFDGESGGTEANGRTEIHMGEGHDLVSLGTSFRGPLFIDDPARSYATRSGDFFEHDVVVLEEADGNRWQKHGDFSFALMGPDGNVVTNSRGEATVVEIGGNIEVVSRSEESGEVNFLRNKEPEKPPASFFDYALSAINVAVAILAPEFAPLASFFTDLAQDGEINGDPVNYALEIGGALTGIGAFNIANDVYSGIQAFEDGDVLGGIGSFANAAAGAVEFVGPGDNASPQDLADFNNLVLDLRGIGTIALGADAVVDGIGQGNPVQILTGAGTALTGAGSVAQDSGLIGTGTVVQGSALVGQAGADVFGGNFGPGTLETAVDGVLLIEQGLDLLFPEAQSPAIDAPAEDDLIVGPGVGQDDLVAGPIDDTLPADDPTVDAAFAFDLNGRTVVYTEAEITASQAEYQRYVDSGGQLADGQTYADIAPYALQLASKIPAGAPLPENLRFLNKFVPADAVSGDGAVTSISPDGDDQTLVAGLPTEGVGGDVAIEPWFINDENPYETYLQEHPEQFGIFVELFAGLFPGVGEAMDAAALLDAIRRG
ncbi:MAG: hypothetical protein AAF772_11125, partial [Acidobacteriota bacterium]